MSHTKLLYIANNNFTVDMYHALFFSVSTENIIFSPFGLHSLFGMVASGGAKGNTRAEILRGLQIRKNTHDETLAKYYNDVMSSLQKRASPRTFTLITASRICTRTGFGLNQKFVKNLKANFQGDVEQLDFSTPHNREVATDRINKCFEEATKGKIKGIIANDILEAKTSVVLANGMYFKGFWKEKFNRSFTTREPFRVSSSHQVNVEMMHHQKNFLYGELPDLKAEAVALPFRGGRLSMVIILPMDIDGLERVKENLGSILVGGRSLIRDSLTTTDKVELSLPKFKAMSVMDGLEDWFFDDLEIKTMFMEESADLSGISDGKKPSGLRVSSVIQKVILEVDEEGGQPEDAKADDKKKPDDNKKGSTSSSSGEPIITIPFLVNHPFYFQIVDHANRDLVLICGHVNDPTVL